MRRCMCFRCGAHLQLEHFDWAQRDSHSPQCKRCMGWPVGMIPVRGMNYDDYVRFKIQQRLAELKEG